MTTWQRVILGGLCWITLSAAAQSPVTFERSDSELRIFVRKLPLATYVWEDRAIRRPFLKHVFAPGGKQVTRTFPPVAGRDAVDHDTMHPGVWLSFGDLNGHDFWRNKAAVELIEFVEQPTATDEGGQFAVKLRYVAEGKSLCEEVCKLAIQVQADGTLLDWQSEFRSPHGLVFGDQEEMGLGVRLATPMTVTNGGTIVNSHGQINERQVWGKAADWCSYSGIVGGQPVGVTLMPAPTNFRPSWFHVRDYGLMVANPFGRNALTRGDVSKVTIPAGEPFRLRFGVFVHTGFVDIVPIYQAWLKRSQ